VSDDLRRLVADLTQAGTKVNAAAAVVVAASAKRVQADARSRAPRKRLPHYARSITHEVRSGMGGVVAEIGPEKGGQGSLAHLFEHGSANTAPKPHLGPALDAEESAFIAALLKVVDPL
jgi:HK97 gp10 family phage protein